MKKFLIEVLSVMIPFAVIVSMYSHISTTILRKYHGLSTEDQIVMQFQNLDRQSDSLTTIYLGSSRFYRAINPDIIGKNGYNFAHDNDSYNQEYYKLLYAYDNVPNLKKVVIAYDYVSFTFLSGTRNYVYHKFFPEDYLNDYSDKFHDNYIYPILNIPQTLPTTIEALIYKERKYLLTSKGQLLFFSGQAKDNDEEYRSDTILPIQDQYFYKIVHFCNDKRIKCIFINMPIRDGEFKNYSQTYLAKMKKKIELCKSKYISYLDYSRVPELLSTALFTDICHYNKKGSDLFSNTLKRDINKDEKMEYNITVEE